MPERVSLLSRVQQTNKRVLQLSSVGRSADKRYGKWHLAEDKETDRQTEVLTVSTNLSRSLVFFLVITLFFLTDVLNYHSCCLHWLQTNNNRISICRYRGQLRIEKGKNLEMQTFPVLKQLSPVLIIRQPKYWALIHFPDVCVTRLTCHNWEGQERGEGRGVPAGSGKKYSFQSMQWRKVIFLTGQQAFTGYDSRQKIFTFPCEFIEGVFDTFPLFTSLKLLFPSVHWQ